MPDNFSLAKGKQSEEDDLNVCAIQKYQRGLDNLLAALPTETANRNTKTEGGDYWTQSR